MCNERDAGYARTSMSRLGTRRTKSTATRTACFIASLFSVAACTRSAAPGGPPAATAVDAPTEREDARVPVGDVPSSAVAPRNADCARACARWIECAGPAHECTPDCEGHLLATNPKAPAYYADCIERLTCEDLVASLAMNSGPAGHCYTSALDAP
jgi:hypothetical protein